MLTIKDLHVEIKGKKILNGINLQVGSGEVHAIMGPNGSGKSTLANVLAGREVYEVTAGEVVFDGRNLLQLKPEERAWQGLFMAFQYPVEIAGLGNLNFLKSSLNSLRKFRGEEELDAIDFLAVARKKALMLEMDRVLLDRGLNEGFSGGEKKRNEVFQMAMLEPKLAILDETDSGLDIDALKAVAAGVNALRSAERSFLVITHYQRLLDYVRPHYVHVLWDGRIVKSGGHELALELEKQGYDQLRSQGWDRQPFAGGSDARSGIGN